jgi:predicted Holliday junction resolvase-like endonuclease
MDYGQAIFWIVTAAAGGLLAGALLMWIRLALDRRDELAAARRQSVAQARVTLKGQIGEQLAPLLPGFAYAPADARFLGDPVDYLVFDGLAAAREGQSDRPVELVVLDIKTGGARLTRTERLLADAVAAGRVRFEVVRIGEDGRVTTEVYRRGKAGA